MVRVGVVLGLLHGCGAFSFSGVVGPRGLQSARVRSSVEGAEASSEAAAEAAAEAAPVEAKRVSKRAREEALALEDIKEGEEYTGKVVGVATYGAFVDIGATNDGLVHISELSATFVSDVGSIVAVGDEVKVRVLKCDVGKKQLSLSMKPEGSAPAPRQGGGGRGGGREAKLEALRAYVDADPSAFIEGVVSNVMPWGAFVTVAPNVDGLVHISAIADERTEDISAVLSVGDTVKVRVVDVDLDKATLALAMDTYSADQQQQRGQQNFNDDDGSGGPSNRPKSPKFKQNRGEGGGDRPRMSRAEPGDDMWDTKPHEAFDWKAAMDNAQLEVEEDDQAAFKIDEATGQFVLN